MMITTVMEIVSEVASAEQFNSTRQQSVSLDTSAKNRI